MRLCQPQTGRPQFYFVQVPPQTGRPQFYFVQVSPQTVQPHLHLWPMPTSNCAPPVSFCAGASANWPPSSAFVAYAFRNLSGGILMMRLANRPPPFRMMRLTNSHSSPERFHFARQSISLRLLASQRLTGGQLPGA